MAARDLPDRQRSSLSVAVGERLRERRAERGLSLREVASTAGISPGHLSEIENGRSHASLPVLLRIGRILNYPLAEMLPRIGGHRVRDSRLDRSVPGATEISHDALELQAISLSLGAGESHEQQIGTDSDAFVFVVEGAIELTVGEMTYPLGERDAADIEKASRLAIAATGEALVFVATCPRD